MKATAKITKVHSAQGTMIWTLYIQKGKHRWLHLASQGTPGLKARAAQYNAEKRDYDVTNRKVWAHVNCTCQRCGGAKCTVNITGQDVTCPRCAGKGYVTISDEHRYDMYCAHLNRSRAERDAAYEAEAARHSSPANRQAAKDGIAYCRHELDPPRDYASMSRGY